MTTETNTPASVIERSRTGFLKSYPGALCVVTAKMNGHFSVTCAVGTTRELKTGNWQAGGCMHAEAVEVWPEVAPIVRLHLSDTDGVPMHAEANGWYWMAPLLPGNGGERYHGGKDKTANECMAILCEHLRISTDEAEALRERLTSIIARHPEAQGLQSGCRKARAYFAQYVDSLKPGWKAEAEEAKRWLSAIE